MYQPFVDMSTVALKYLRDLAVDGMREADSEVDITFQVNDNKVISQTHGDTESSRKPDIIIIPSHLDDFMEPKEDKKNSRRKGKAKGKQKMDKRKICWKDILGFVEFKRRGEVDTSKQSPEGLSSSDGVPPSGQQTLHPPTQSKSEVNITLQIR